jgi:hypothetical protein
MGGFCASHHQFLSEEGKVLGEILSLVRKRVLSLPEAKRVVERYPSEVWVCPLCGALFLLVHLRKKRHKLFRVKLSQGILRKTIESCRTNV